MKLPHLSLGAWIAIGIIGGAVALPTATYAATGHSLVTITDATSGNTATVDSAGRVLAAPTPPGEMITIQGNFVANTCTNFYTVPKSKALIITAADFLLSSRGETTDVHYSQGDVYADLGPNCTIDANTRYLASGAVPLADNSLIAAQDQNHDYGTGIAVPAGTVLGNFALDSSGNVLLFGYLVPKNSVPADAMTSVPRADRLGHPLAP